MTYTIDADGTVGEMGDVVKTPLELYTEQLERRAAYVKALERVADAAKDVIGKASGLAYPEYRRLAEALAALEETKK